MWKSVKVPFLVVFSFLKIMDRVQERGHNSEEFPRRIIEGISLFALG